MTDSDDCLGPTDLIDSDNPAVQAYAKEAAKGEVDPKQRALNLYYAVRDDFRYDPYTVSMTRDHFRASACLELAINVDLRLGRIDLEAKRSLTHRARLQL